MLNAGLYVISFVTCLQRNVGHTVQAMINGIANTAVYITDTVHKAEDTASITFLASLPANSYLSLALVAGSIYSDIRHLTALGGFLYSPPAAISVAWQLYRSTELTIPTDPVSFDIVAIDTGRPTLILALVHYSEMTKLTGDEERQRACICI